MNRRLFVTFVLLAGLTVAAQPGPVAASVAWPAGHAGTGDAATVASTQPLEAREAPGAAVNLPAGASSDWWAGMQEGIRRSEYQVTWQERTALPGLGPAYQAPNRAQGLRTYFTPTGIRIVPRVEASPTWEWGLRLAGCGRGTSLDPVAPSEPAVASNRVEYRRGGVVEWYVNDEGGLEQGFTLAEPPQGGAGDLVLELALGGSLTPALAEGGAALDLTTSGGVRALRYGELKALDATGRALPGHLEIAPGDPARLRILVDDAGAVYPLTIDPLATSPGWSAEGNQAGALFGLSVGTAGDVNGDGYADVIVGAQGYDCGLSDAGRAFVFHGSPDGLGTGPGWFADGEARDVAFGRAVGTAGDVNGDGYADVVVGAPAYNQVRGRAYVFLGSASGLASTPAWTATGDLVLSDLGWSVGTAGDVNGDGYADVIVGAFGHDTARGQARVYHGSANGLEANPAWTAAGEQEGSMLGVAAGTAGDVNGDGYTDVVVGAPASDIGGTDDGRAYLYLGSAGGLGASAAWSVDGAQTKAMLGWSVGTAGDVNGDGYADLIVGEPGYDGAETDAGRARVYHGSAGGPTSSADLVLEGSTAGGWFGTAAGTTGDVNGDGYADIAVAASGSPFTYVLSYAGRVCVYQGSESGLGSAPAWSAESEQPDALFGFSVGPAGDVDGDGYADIVVGAPAFDGGERDEGRAYVYHGSPSGPSGAPGWSAEGDRAAAFTGSSVATAGDVNGDGYADVIVGAQSYDGSVPDAGRAVVYHGSPSGLSRSPAWAVDGARERAAFGASVSTAGDVNGDGYDDVIVGAPADGGGGMGRAYVFLGSPNGLATTPAWSIQGEIGLANLGTSVGAAGDVDGDGYGDVIVGGIYGGRVYVHYGSPEGLSPIADWTADGDQPDSFFGHSVGTAGDVNGDGYSDVVVGAPRYNNGEGFKGRAYLYLGSAAGLASTPSWTATGDQAGAGLGLPVGTAGDVNGDGFADIIVASPGHDGGGQDAGRACVFLGSATGPGSTPAWIGSGDRALAFYGGSAGTAGDVNGDGYADVVVGAPDPTPFNTQPTYGGRAYLYLGSSHGLATVASWSVESDQPGAALGVSVGTAGDVNGDGYADLVVSAPGYDGDQPDEGQVLLFYGNGGAGLSLAPRQLRAESDAPIAHLGLVPGDAFRLALQGRTPFGRGKVRLQWEVKPLGTPFDGSSLGTSEAWADTGTAGAALDELVAGLAGNTSYHWRVRLLYHPAGTPFQQRSRWLTQPWNGWQEARLRAGTAVNAADLSLALDDVPDPVGAGALLTYTLAVTNGGPSAARGVVVTDTLPAGVAFAGASGSGWVCEESGGVVTCRRPSLRPGPAPAITIRVTVPTEGGTIANTAEVGSAIADPNPVNNAASAETRVTALADLFLSIALDPDPAYHGQPLRCTLGVANAGPSAAEEVVLTATLPVGAEFVSADGAGWVCEQTADGVSCRRASLAAGEGAPIEIVVVPRIAGRVGSPHGEWPAISATARISAATEDPNEANNSAEATTTVVRLADLSLSMRLDPDPAYDGQPLTVTLGVASAGPCTAESVVVTATLPVGAEFVSADGTGWVCEQTADGVVCRRPSLARGEQAPVAVVVVPWIIEWIEPPYVEWPAISSTAQVSASTEDPDLANNSAQAETTIVRLADLALSIEADPDPVYVTERVTYTLRPRNDGPCEARSFVVTATLSGGALVSADGAGWSCEEVGGVIVCGPAQILPFFGDAFDPVRLRPGDESEIRIVADTPAEGGTIAITAGIGDVIPDPDPANNVASAQATVIPRADLALSLSDAPDPTYASAPLTYTLVVSNAGPSTATSVVVTQTLPAGTSFVAAAGDGWECQQDGAGRLICRRAALPVGLSTIAITVTAPGTPDLELSNGGETPGLALITAVATVTAAEEDRDPINNGAECVTSVRPGLHLGG